MDLKKAISFLIFLLMSFFVMAQSGSDEQLANQFWQQGEKEKAFDLYKEIYQKKPSLYVYQRYLEVLIEENQLDEALKLVQKQQRQDKKQWLPMVDLGRVYVRKGETPKAEKQYQNVIDNLDAASLYTISELATYFYTQAQSYYWATQVYLKARKVLDDPTAYAYELAGLYRVMQKIPEMLDEYLLFLKENPPLSSYVQSALQSLLSEDATQKFIEQIKKNLYQKAQKEPQNFIVQDLLIWTLLQEKQYTEAFIQAKTYQVRFKDAGAKVWEVASVASKNEAFPQAEEAYKYLIASGSEQSFYKMARIDLLQMYYKRLRKETYGGDLRQEGEQKAHIEKIKNDYLNLWAEFPQDASTLELRRNLAQIYAYYTAESDKAITLLEEAIELPYLSMMQKAECKIDLADILLYTGNVWDATLLYAQVEKSFKQDAIGFSAKLKNAMLSYYNCDFLWAKSQFDVLKAATSKLIANDAMEYALLIKENNNTDSTYEGLCYVAKADAMVLRTQWERALSLLDSVFKMPNEDQLWDDVYLRKAEIYQNLKQGDSALYYYTKIVEECENSLLMDDALFALAEIYQSRPEQIQEALRYYERLFMEYPSSTLSPKAKERYRSLCKP